MGNTKNLTVLGYASLSPEMEKKVFGSKTQKYIPTSEEKNSIIDEMEKFGVEFPIKNPESFFIPDFNLPNLEADTIQEHFKVISEDLIGDKCKIMKEFANSSIPNTHQDFINKKGWIRYSKEGVNPVPYPSEDIFIFDCETFVKGSNFGHPILATAVSDKAYYIWMHECYVNPYMEYEPTLVPVGKNKIIIAHNVAFDRARTEEAYLLGENTNFWFDTMSAHINVSGLASGQRWYFLQKGSKNFGPRPQWSDKGCLNNLIDCYNFHCHPIIPLEPEDKKIRDIFVVSETMEEIVKYKDDLTKYALNDVKITYELYSILFIKYLQSNPSLTTLLGHFAISSAQLPVVDDWDKWFADCEHQWEKSIARQEEILGEMADSLYEEWSAGLIEPENDPWLSQLDWSMDTKVTKTGKTGKYYMIPAWYKPRIKTGKPMEVSTKNRLSHILLRLKWDGQPIRYFTDKGWCYMDDEQGDYVRIPHTQGEGVNVGGVLTKDYVEDFESGMLSSDSEAAKELISLSVNVAYWTSVRSRVLEQFVKQIDNPLGSPCNLIVPATIPHNTSTNRAGENLWLTVPDPKYLKIGSEIKTRVQAPEGWTFVQSDFDAQEAVIASIFSDSRYKVAGSSQFSHSILAGNKDDGSDMHSMTAKAIGISRAVAKGCNYGMLYGCGAKTLANTIRKGNKTIPMKKAIELGQKLIEIKKGKKLDRNSNFLIGGSDSHAYNEMARIATMPIPVNPLSGSKMSTAFRPQSVGDDFWTMRNNWCIQSTGSAMLHAFLTGMEYLLKRYEIKAKFCMAVHDSILFMTPKENAEKVAFLFQVAHVWSWAWMRANYEVYEMPVANAWLSSIEIDPIFRKAATAPTKTISQQKDEPNGYSVTIHDLIPVSELI